MEVIVISEWFKNMFIDEVKPAMDHHGESQLYTLVDENNTELLAVLVGKETVFDATPNDIRIGKVAATTSGITVGTKEIPAYYVMEGYAAIPAGSRFAISANELCEYTDLQAIVCPYNGSIAASVAADKVVIGEHIYAVNSTDSLGTVTKNSETHTIDLGFFNDSGIPYVVRYFGYKEEH